jgi:hypothetical protein
MKVKVKAKYFAKIKTAKDDENRVPEECVREVVFNTNYRYEFINFPELPEYCQ